MKHGVLLVAAGLLTVLLTANVDAQNTAQQAALARLGRAQAHASVHAQAHFTPPNGVEASSVSLNQPAGLAFDSAGDLYIADTEDNVILEVTVAGIINTVAGNGGQGFGGDGGAATAALLDSPVGVALDSSGNIFIGDTHNNRVREVLASTGNISTIAGTGAAGYAGDGGAATAAQLDRPTQVAVDTTGNVYIADSNNNRIREISGATIQTVAGNGQQGFSGDGGAATGATLNSPTGVAVDAAFNIYISDTLNQRVRMVTFSTGIIGTIAGTGGQGFNGDGPATTSTLDDPSGLSVDASGNVYVADSDNFRIREISGGNITTTAGNGAQGFGGFTAPTSASLDTPLAVAVQGTTLAFADTSNNSVGEVTNGQENTTAGVAASGLESLALAGANSTTYGTGTLTATFSNNSQSGTGLVTFYDGAGPSPTMIGQASLSANTVALNTSTLAAGTHYIVASYTGDSRNAAIASSLFVLNIKPAALTAVANAVSLLYGQTIPTLPGTLIGVLAQDSGNVTASFSSTATITSAPGAYPIAVKLTGSAAANYSVTLGSTSGALAISQAPSTILLAPSSGTPILGAPETLTATVASTTTGTPTGAVNFFDGTTLLNSSPVALSGGTAAISITTLPVGALSLTAVYSGDTDFKASTSTVIAVNNLSPDFTVASSPASQSIVPTQSVNYTLTVTPLNSTFLYPVSLSASGLPTGVTATFSPASIATGAATSNVTLTLNSTARAKLEKREQLFEGTGSPIALSLLLLPLAFNRRFRRYSSRLAGKAKLLIVLLALVVTGAISGCGGSGFFGQATGTYTLTVTAVSGPDTHTSTVTLTVQ